jgi:hypothetical protein
MKVSMANCLSPGTADVRPNVESIRLKLFVEKGTQLRRHSPHDAQLTLRECQEIRLVTSRNDEDMPGVEWRRVVEGNAERVDENKVRVLRDPVAEDA